MKTIRGWDGLKPYGIEILTGEACAYSLRGLFDVNPAGVRLLREFFCIYDMRLPENWNGGDGATGSAMLSYELLGPLAMFALLTVDKCPVVYWTADGNVSGIESGPNEDYELNLAERVFRPTARRVITNPGYQRNTHQMSGRTW